MLLVGGVFAIVIGLERALASRRAWWGSVVGGGVAVALGMPRGLLLSKSIGLLVMPLGLLWAALLALGLGLGVRRRGREAAVALSIALVLTALGSRPLADWALRGVEGEHGDARPLAEAPFDAVIVLGGGTDDRPGGVQLGRSGDRVMLGARLFHAGKTPLLLTSGAPIAGLSTHDSAAATRRIWRSLGVPDGAIITIDGARTTGEEARRYARWMREHDVNRVGLVTSAFHMRRALGRFAAEGLTVIPLPADVRGEAPTWRGFYSLVPDARAAGDLHTAAWEVVGRLAGR